jgi:hypothetical protein
MNAESPEDPDSTIVHPNWYTELILAHRLAWQFPSGSIEPQELRRFIELGLCHSVRVESSAFRIPASGFIRGGHPRLPLMTIPPQQASRPLAPFVTTQRLK